MRPETLPASPGTPQLHFQGVIKTAEPSNEMPSPPLAAPNRGVLHGDSVFAIHGERILSSLWDELSGP